ncbi:DNA-processing protein DprA [Frigoribacterium sp. CG_9.8]|uniref:DNA-processing protein DprA n=1 Tax=Frigoribacterium sp. CG_9.8 TaxID=2787733 RepID=UPI0018C99492|nr:DNA-processing protein DprA [Frigoribacterium sp. CG_9.8]MBG6107054.1 DNA processing protein [Frigoribacterium sp. CG_9.8]
MSMFGLDSTEITGLIKDLAPGPDPDPGSVAELFARASWTGIAEPGDRAAGELVASLGPDGALTALVEAWPVARIMDAASVAGSDLTAADLASALARWAPRLKSGVALVALRQAVRFRVRLLVPGDPAWPIGVDDLGPHAPIALWLRGNKAALAAARYSIALVGARAATGYGEHVTMEASAGLVDRGFAIISGAAYGIDGMAHRAALASSGQTVAILAGGVDRFYPSGHDALLARIVESGAVVSELPCGSPPTKWRFLQRNRLIAAASQATIVLEAGWRSGSLNTAGHAASLGRPIGAMPGPVTSAASAGCHRLIREFAATLVTTASEMAELVLGTDMQEGEAQGSEEQGGEAQQSEVRTSSDAPGGQSHPTSARVRLTDALSLRAPRTVDDLAARSGMSIADVQAELGALEIDGGAMERERGWVSRRS